VEPRKKIADEVPFHSTIVLSVWHHSFGYFYVLFPHASVSSRCGHDSEKNFVRSIAIRRSSAPRRCLPALPAPSLSPVAGHCRTAQGEAGVLLPPNTAVARGAMAVDGQICTAATLQGPAAAGSARVWRRSELRGRSSAARQVELAGHVRRPRGHDGRLQPPHAPRRRCSPELWPPSFQICGLLPYPGSQASSSPGSTRPRPARFHPPSPILLLCCRGRCLVAILLIGSLGVASRRPKVRFVPLAVLLLLPVFL